MNENNITDTIGKKKMLIDFLVRVLEETMIIIGQSGYFQSNDLHSTENQVEL